MIFSGTFIVTLIPGRRKEEERHMGGNRGKGYRGGGREQREGMSGRWERTEGRDVGEAGGNRGKGYWGGGREQREGTSGRRERTERRDVGEAGENRGKGRREGGR
jgi:hypothetical protein